MTLYRIKLNWIVGGVFALIFLALFALRLGIFQERESGEQEALALTALARTDREIWMNILQQGRKIGYLHRQFFKNEDGYRIQESVSMQVNTLGMLQDVRFRTEGNFHQDMTLSSFDFELQSSLFRFKARGAFHEKKLTILVDQGSGAEQKISFPLQKAPYFSVALLDAFHAENLQPGESKLFHVFDPATVAQRPVKIVFLGEETISIMGRKEKARKVSVDYMGAPQYAWIGKDGSVLREEGAFGLRLEQVLREEALKGDSLSPVIDLAEAASLLANKMIQHPDRLKELKIKLKGIEEKDIFLDGDRQTVRESILTIQKESVPSLSLQRQAGKDSKEPETSLGSDLFIQSDHPVIQSKAKEIVLPSDSDRVKAEKLIQWVHKNIEKRPVLSVPSALETLQNGVGDCNEHAVLLAALARASGIPSQVEAGLVYQKGRFYYHAWNVLYLDRWITADAVMGQFPADVTHIRFVRGTDRQVDLIRIIGNIELEILSFF
jgi:hypothetical protein